MKYGYARVSEFDPPHFHKLQLERLREHGCSDACIFVEKRSGVIGKRPAYTELMSLLQPGDEVATWSLERIGRSIDHVISFVNEVSTKGAWIRTLGEGPQNITTNPADNASAAPVFEMLGRFRKKLDEERTLFNEKYMGKKQVRSQQWVLGPTEIQRIQHVLATRSVSLKVLCSELGVSGPTIYQYVHPSGALRPRGKKVLSAMENRSS